MSPIARSQPVTARVFGGRRHVFGDAAFAFVAILWLGFLLGVSFLATPAKFLAPSLDLPTALDVGRVTFALFSKTEWLLCAGLVVIALLSPGPGGRRIAVGGLAALLAAQTFWLLPVLDARVVRIIAGGAVAATNHHLIYVAADSAKALLLLALSVGALRTLCAPRAAVE
ncbi:hypothetical protein ACUSIJ_29215 [Pseudochelatococcus sp. B33]